MDPIFNTLKIFGWPAGRGCVIEAVFSSKGRTGLGGQEAIAAMGWWEGDPQRIN